MADAPPHDGLASLVARWDAADAASVRSIRTLASPPPTSATATMAAAKLAPGVLDAATLEMALACEAAVYGGTARAVEELNGGLMEMEEIVEAMHALVRDARDAASVLPLSVAVDRGEHGLQRSAVDRAATLAAPLRAYEAELALRWRIFEALQSGCAAMAPGEADALLVAWESRPMLLPVEAMMAGADAQKALERALADGGAATVPPHALNGSQRVQA